MPGLVLINPAGEEEFVGPSRVKEALANGYKTAGGENVTLQQPSGVQYTVAAEDLGSPAVGGFGTAVGTGADALGEQTARWNNEEFGGVGGGVAATGLGALRGGTLGLSDAALTGLGVEARTLRGYREENPGLSLAGEIGGGIATSLATGGLGGIAAGRALAPGSKAAAALIAGSTEGAIQGAGTAVSNLILKDEPLTAEAVFNELGPNVFLGAVAGGAGGALGNKLESMGSAIKVSKVADDVVSANSANAIPLDSARGKIIAEDFTGGLDQSFKLADEFAAEVSKRPVAKAVVEAAAPVVDDAVEAAAPKGATSIADLPDEFFTHGNEGRNAIRFVDDAATEAVDHATMLENKALLPQIRKVQKARRELNAATVADLPDGASSEVVATGATKSRNTLYGPGSKGGADIGVVKARLTELHDAVTALAQASDNPAAIEAMLQGGRSELGNRLGGLGQYLDGSIPTKPTEVIAKNVDSIAPNAIAPEVAESAKAYTAAKTTLTETLFVRNGKVGKRTLDVMAELEAPEAMKVAQAYSEMAKHGAAMADALGPDFAVKAAKLSEELAKVRKAIGTLAAPAKGTEGMSAAQMMAGLGIAAEAGDLLPDVDGPADEMLKLWLLARVAKGRGLTGGATSGRLGKLGNWIRRSVKSGSRLQGFRQFKGAGFGGAITGALGSSASGMAADYILGTTSKLAQATNKSVAVGEATVARLLSGGGKAIKRASAVAPSKILSAVRFADVDHEPGTTPFEQRAHEIRLNVANSMGVQHTVLENLGDMGVTHQGVADKVIKQADNFNKFLAQKLPRDPGTVMRFGKSGWKPSEQDIAKFTRFMTAALNPDSVIAAVADGSVTPEGAETLRVLYPAKFAKFQQVLWSHASELQSKLPYTRQVQLSVLFQTPICSTMDPIIGKQLRASFAADAGSDPVSAPPPGVTSAPHQLSPAQQLLTR